MYADQECFINLYHVENALCTFQSVNNRVDVELALYCSERRSVLYHRERTKCQVYTDCAWVIVHCLHCVVWMHS